MANRLIAFDGLDASGKKTQLALLEKRLSDEGEKPFCIDFPRYKNESSFAVRMYLEGRLGAHAGDTNPYTASSFFAIDRYISYVTEWKSLFLNGELIIADRYTSANAVHQLSKLDKSEWRGFLDWLFDYEFVKLGIPAPSMTVFLEMRPDVALKLIERRAASNGLVKDIHESDPSHIYKSYEAAMFACEYCGWTRISCCRDGDDEPLSREIISDMVFAAAKKAL